MKDQGFSGDLFLWKLNDEFRDWVYESPAARVACPTTMTRVAEAGMTSTCSV